MASIRDTLAGLFAKESPSAIQGTPLGKAYPNLAQPEPGLEAPFLSPDDLIGTGIGKAALAGGAKLAPLLLGHTAFHGSPHIFDKFMLEKLGSGEGAQVYGHGMYFAENPKVAKEYQNRLADFSSPYTFEYQDKIFEPSYLDNVKDPVRHAVSLTYHQGKPTAQKIAKLGLEDAAKGEAYALEMGGKDYYQQMLDTANTLNKKDIKAQQGAFYKVDIPDEHVPKMLDWDKPLNQQNNILTMLRSPEVQNKLADADIGFQELNMPANEIYRKLSIKFGQKEASNILNQAGIPGIKYLDQGSRAAGGTRNFVVFDPSNVKMLERNNKIIDLLKNK